MQGNGTLALYLEHRRSLVRYASGIVGDQANAEDVVQEAYIRFSKGDGVPRPGGAIAHPVNYLYRIVRNLAFDWARRPAPDMPSEEEASSLPAETPSIEDVLLYRDELRVLAEALSELPERTRLAFRLYRLEGRSLREVADTLGVSIVRAHQLVKEAVVHGARRLDERQD